MLGFFLNIEAIKLNQDYEYQYHLYEEFERKLKLLTHWFTQEYD